MLKLWGVFLEKGECCKVVFKITVLLFVTNPQKRLNGLIIFLSWQLFGAQFLGLGLITTSRSPFLWVLVLKFLVLWLPKIQLPTACLFNSNAYAPWALFRLYPMTFAMAARCVEHCWSSQVYNPLDVLSHDNRLCMLRIDSKKSDRPLLYQKFISNSDQSIL